MKDKLSFISIMLLVLLFGFAFGYYFKESQMKDTEKVISERKEGKEMTRTKFNKIIDTIQGLCLMAALVGAFLAETPFFLIYVGVTAAVGAISGIIRRQING